MKKIVISACALALSCGLLFGCAAEEATETTEETTEATEVVEDTKVEVTETGVAMQQLPVADAKANQADYVFVDVRKAADYEAGHIDGALSADMDAAVNGDYATGVTNMQAIEKDIEDKKVVLVCYSGKKYAQAATDVLNAMGFNMENVYTLEGGMKAWDAADALAAETQADTAATTDTAAKAEATEEASTGGSCA